MIPDCYVASNFRNPTNTSNLTIFQEKSLLLGVWAYKSFKVFSSKLERLLNFYTMYHIIFKNRTQVLFIVTTDCSLKMVLTGDVSCKFLIYNDEEIKKKGNFYAKRKGE